MPKTNNAIERLAIALELSMEIDKLILERKTSNNKYVIDVKIEKNLKEMIKLNKIPYWYKGIYSNE